MDSKRKEVPVYTSRRVKAQRLRLHEEVEILRPFGVADFTVPYDVAAEHFLAPLLLLHSIHSWTVLLSRLLHPQLNCHGSRCAKPTHNEKALSTGPRAVSFLFERLDGERRLGRREGGNPQ